MEFKPENITDRQSYDLVKFKTKCCFIMKKVCLRFGTISRSLIK